jgi:hypothetical protein
MFDEGKSKSEIEDVPLIVPSQSFRTLDVVCSAVLDAYPLLTLVFFKGEVELHQSAALRQVHRELGLDYSSAGILLRHEVCEPLSFIKIFYLIIFPVRNGIQILSSPSSKMTQATFHNIVQEFIN